VRAHLLVCMLAWRLRWQLEARLKPVLFNDEEPGGAPRKSHVAKARRSASGNQKAATRQMNSASNFRLDRLLPTPESSIKHPTH
jgi:hypothetical protein